MTPELWTRCPKAERRLVLAMNLDEPGAEDWACWACRCHGIDNSCLVRVPFDEAVQRVMPFVTISHDRRHLTDAGELAFRRAAAEAILRAALGEGTE